MDKSPVVHYLGLMDTTTALSDLKPGDRFTIDGGPVLIFRAVDHNESTPEVRITFREDAGHPGHRRTLLLTDAMDHTFRRA